MDPWLHWVRVRVKIQCQFLKCTKKHTHNRSWSKMFAINIYIWIKESSGQKFNHFIHYVAAVSWLKKIKLCYSSDLGLAIISHWQVTQLPSAPHLVSLSSSDLENKLVNVCSWFFPSPLQLQSVNTFFINISHKVGQWNVVWHSSSFQAVLTILVDLILALCFEICSLMALLHTRK